MGNRIVIAALAVAAHLRAGTCSATVVTAADRVVRARSHLPPGPPMPRSFPSGIAAAFGGLLLLSACAKESFPALGRAPAKGPLKVNVTCDSDVSVGLTDVAGDQAWAFEAKGKEAVEWQGSASVTSIQAKRRRRIRGIRDVRRVCADRVVVGTLPREGKSQFRERRDRRLGE